MNLKNREPLRESLREPLRRAAILVLCITALSASTLLAQDTSAPPPAPPPRSGPAQGAPGGPGQREQNQIQFLTKKLNLTPDQVSQVQAIDDDSRQQMMAVRKDATIAKPDKRAKMMDIHKASQDKIRAILTDDQKPRFDAMQARMQQRREEREGAGGPPPPPASAPPPQQ